MSTSHTADDHAGSSVREPLESLEPPESPELLESLGAVVCDIDGTLTATSSALAVTQALGVPVSAHAHLYRAYRAGMLAGDALRHALLTLWAGATRDRLEEAFGGVPLREGADRFLGAVRAAGVPLVLITSSVQEYADATARRLGAVLAHGGGRVRYDHDGVLTDLEMHATDDAQMAALKARQFHAAARELKVAAHRVLVVGNGPNDLGLFAATPHSVLIDPIGNSPHRDRAAHAVPGLEQAADLVTALAGTATA